MERTGRLRLRPLARTALALVVGTVVFGLSVAVGGLLGAVLFFGVALLVQVTVTTVVLIPALVLVGSPLMTAAGWSCTRSLPSPASSTARSSPPASVGGTCAGATARSPARRA